MFLFESNLNQLASRVYSNNQSWQSNALDENVSFQIEFEPTK